MQSHAAGQDRTSPDMPFSAQLYKSLALLETAAYDCTEPNRLVTRDKPAKTLMKSFSVYK